MAWSISMTSLRMVSSLCLPNALLSLPRISTMKTDVNLTENWPKTRTRSRRHAFSRFSCCFNAQIDDLLKSIALVLFSENFLLKIWIVESTLTQRTFGGPQRDFWDSLRAFYQPLRVQCFSRIHLSLSWSLYIFKVKLTQKIFNLLDEKIDLLIAWRLSFG
jgi:hypothetical protein